MSSLRSITCGLLRATDTGSDVQVCGWVNSRRDHGGVIFIDLRDHTGLVQVVFEPAEQQAFALAESLRPEYVIHVSGKIRLRPNDTANADLPTGEIEIQVAHADLLSRAHNIPFQPEDREVTEETRLKHRVMHLRSSAMQHNLRVRHRITAQMRITLDKAEFVEVETPMLTSSSPEGARDFLVPSRNQPGSFYALPQSPQLFKQVLIAGGIDRYYQFPRCFRDEDLRAGRQPEFTQLDMELAFVAEQDVMSIAEQVVRAGWSAAQLDDLGDIPQMKYAAAMCDYGCDAPDLSITLQLTDVLDLVRNSKFKVFADPAAKPDSRIVALNAPGGGSLSRKNIDDLTAFVRSLGAGGLAYIKIDEPGRGVAGVTSPIAKFLDDTTIDSLIERCQSQAGDVVFFGAGSTPVVNSYMAPLRVMLGQQLQQVKPGYWPVWITDFPLFEKDVETGRIASVHHPFTAPVSADTDRLLAGADLLELKSRAYDLVLNGNELGGGSIRIHDAQLQLAALAALGLDQQTAEAKFGFLLSTLRQGIPPHGGIAFGLDRIVAMAVGADSIREVIAFPKSQSGACPFTSAPTDVSRLQLAELGLALRKQKPQTA